MAPTVYSQHSSLSEAKLIVNKLLFGLAVELCRSEFMITTVAFIYGEIRDGVWVVVSKIRG